MPKILLVEDNMDSRIMLTRRLIKYGYTNIITAEDGETAITLAHTECPDLILMDMSLPIVDGWEATQLLKSDAHTRQIPIIGLSANAMPEDIRRGLDAGCNDYDTKPIEFDRLIKKIELWLNSTESN